ncbi:MAG: hypothetical protein E7400_06685 [Ruminococcaceae bacterium]|nr:hypothetical protein [Oscillospiraceae bacterium]
MRMEDSLLIRSLDRAAGHFNQAEAHGVLCTVTDAVETDGRGFVSGGQLIVRIPERESVAICCGDEVSHDGGVSWFTVTEIRDNRRADTPLSHRKVIGRR